jgi:PAS domain S-box-containing protein
MPYDRKGLAGAGYCGKPISLSNYKSMTIYMMMVGCIAVVWYSKIFEIEIVFTHLFYIPIVLAGVWWRKNAIYAALALALVLIVSDIVSYGFTSIVLLRDVIRAAIFCAVAVVIGQLSVEIHRHRQEAVDYAASLEETVASGTMELKGTRNYLHNILYSMPAGIFAVDNDSRITSFNRAAEEITGYAEQDVIGMKCSDVLKTSLCRDPMTDHAKGGAIIFSGIETTLRTRTGEVVHISMNGYLLKDDGEIAGRVVWFEDITAQKAAEVEKQELQEQLFRSKKLAAVGELAAGVAHEVNNPLTGIINYAELIKDETEKDSENYRFLDGIIKESERIADITDSLLTFARQDEQTHSPAQINGILDSALLLMTPQFTKDGITLIRDCEELPAIKVRSNQIEQVFINLISNAQHALNARYGGYDEGKILKISTKKIIIDSKDYIQIVVCDTGVGIAPEFIDRIFDPFFTTRRGEGTGLGLSISYGIIADHHGKISVESEPGQATTFTIDLPINNGLRLDQEVE